MSKSHPQCKCLFMCAASQTLLPAASRHCFAVPAIHRLHPSTIHLHSSSFELLSLLRAACRQRIAISDVLRLIHQYSIYIRPDQAIPQEKHTQITSFAADPHTQECNKIHVSDESCPRAKVRATAKFAVIKKFKLPTNHLDIRAPCSSSSKPSLTKSAVYCPRTVPIPMPSGFQLTFVLELCPM